MGMFDPLFQEKTPLFPKSNGYSKIGSPSDVSLLNQGDVSSLLNTLRTNLGGSYGSMLDSATNYENYIKQLMGNSTLSGFQASLGSLFDTAQGDASKALSDVYSTTRAQAQNASNDALNKTAEQMANSGLLQSGGAVNAMTQAAVAPTLQAETALANTRANYLSNEVNNLYGTAAQLTQADIQNILSALSGQAGLASSQYGTDIGALTSMSQPVYWQPQYEQNKGLLDYLAPIASIAALFV